jgi:hypothetical protein
LPNALGDASSRERAESELDVTKTLASFDFAEVPMLSKAHVMALAAGDSLEKGASILIFGPPRGPAQRTHPPPGAISRSIPRALVGSLAASARRAVVTPQL